MMSETIRAFIALELDDAIKEALHDLQETLKQAGLNRGIRWVKPEHMHLTLKFLGDAPTGRVTALEEALRQASVGISPFRLEVSGLGRFPPRGPARVLWVGLEGELGALQALHAKLEARAAALGFAAETRAFKPHLTLGRLQGSQDLSNVLRASRSVNLGSFSADRLTLFRSELGSSGPRYTRLAQLRL